MLITSAAKATIKVLVVAAAYFACAKIGFQFAPENREITAFWPATGSNLFLMFLWGPISGLGILLGSFIFQLTLGVPQWVAISMSSVDTLESIVPYFLLLRLRADFHLYSVRDVICFCSAAFLGVALSSALGNAIISADGSERWSLYWSNFSVWLAANFTGSLVLAPVLIALWRGDTLVRGRRTIEFGALLLTAAALTFSVFWLDQYGQLTEMEYLMLPLIAWAGLRFGINGVAWAMLICTIVAITGTLHGHGVYRNQTFNVGLMLLQSFICVCAITGHLMAASLYERRQAAAALQASHSELEGRVEERTRELKEMALQDTLTGLPNRRWMLDHLGYALGMLHRNPDYSFGLLFLDLDRFKIVNDSLGHQAGDYLLQAVAKRLKSVIRDGDAVARLGGDEFTIFINDFDGHSSGTSVANAAERILDSLSQSVVLNGRDIFISGSIGIALSASGYSTPEEMLRDADTAMYRAKQSGAGRFEVFDMGMHKTAMGRLVIESDLRKAIERGEFLLHYQPIITFDSAMLVGFEALIRWNHPERGFIAPIEFIPVAEETGLIVTIGTWVLKEACSFLGQWRAENSLAADLIISVNVSAAQLLRSNFSEVVTTILEETELPGNRLKLELTESTLIKHSLELSKSLDELRNLGIEVMIDDFGTGFSSLSYLAHLPMDALKVDRSFISGSHKTAESIEIVRCIVAMAKALGIRTVAEGVETKEQSMWVEAMECDYAQGYYFSRPVDASAAKKMAELPALSLPQQTV